MPPRATWKGHLKLSLVTIAVRAYNATTTASRITLKQLHKGCNGRLRQQMVCPIHGNVDRADIARGYEYEKDRYVIIEADELTRIQAQTTKAIEVTQFVDPSELQPIYLRHLNIDKYDFRVDLPHGRKGIRSAICNRDFETSPPQHFS